MPRCATEGCGTKAGLSRNTRKIFRQIGDFFQLLMANDCEINDIDFRRNGNSRAYVEE